MMALNYDFDMLSMTASAAPDDTGTDVSSTGKPVALFRDAATVEALERAPQPVQDYLRASCFGINCYHSGAPAGRYPVADEAARIAVIEALAENVRRFDLPRADDSQPDVEVFHLPSFFAAVAEAEPMAMEPVIEVQPMAMEPVVVAEAEPLAMEPVAEVQPMAMEPAFVADAEPTAMEPVAEVAPLAMEPATVAEAEPVALDMAAQAVAEMLAMDMAAEPENVPDFAPMIADETDSLISCLILSQDMRVDLPPAAPKATGNLIADMFAEAAAEADAETPDAVDLPPAHIAARRGFRLPTLPRWMTAGAAFVVLGVAVGSAVI